MPSTFFPGQHRKRLEQMFGDIWRCSKSGGGYVFNNVHNIQADVPAENIIALFDAAYEFGFYERDY